MPEESAAEPNVPTAQVIAILERFKTLRTLIRGVVGVALVYYGVAVPITATAGEETVLTVAYRTVVDLDVHVVVSYSATVLFGWLWWRERTTRITAVERENLRNKELEKKIDPDRTSSGFKEKQPTDTSPGGA